jgi:hypothetical protein
MIVKKMFGFLIDNKFVSHEELALEFDKLQAENKKLREALEFYENCTRLMLDVRDLPKDPVLGYSIVSSKSIMDNGDVAREALKEVGEK